MKKERIKKLSQYESALQHRLNSAAIREVEPKPLADFAESYYNDRLMTRKEEARHVWVMETMMFQRIAKTGEDTYEELSDYYDSCYGKKPVNVQETAASNASAQRIILEMGSDG